MPRDGFKTQVLLLHSEQSTLDSLSSGFGDGYTVHCATSGSEALNTLGETPINVIVTAQDLPGMSGLEALREAKKRSPETIGILLAGDADEGLEALVGNREVFQVVRGSVTRDSISRLVENATQQIRMTTLAKSANDAAAAVDEPQGEHIVMETSDNGSAIISDGTGRMPALDPSRIGSSTSFGSQAVGLLVLTRDDEFLATIKDSSRGTHTVHYGNTLAQADTLIREHKIGVAVVDAAMVGEKIEQLTAHLRKGSPRIVTIVAGRRDDGEMMMDLINRSKVYRFLLKPVSPGRARLAIEASVKHHLEAPEAAFKLKGAARSAPASLNSKAESPGKSANAGKTLPETGVEPSDIRQTGAWMNPSSGTAASGSPSSAETSASAEAPGSEKSGLTETVSNLFNSVGRKLSRDDDQQTASLDDSGPVAEYELAGASSGGSKRKNTKIVAFGVLGVALIGAAIFWFAGGSDVSAPARKMTSGDPAAVLPDAVRNVVDSAGDAGDTRDAEAEPGVDAAVKPGGDQADVAALVKTTLADAESALLQSRIEDAIAALEIVAAADPDNSRLPFLTTQLSQLQLREHLGDARAAIRESRYEEAFVALDAARALQLPDTTEIDTVENELDAARSAQRVEEVLLIANTRLEENKLLEPPNDNARYYFELALGNDPDNAAARQGLSLIASKLALQARSETDEGNLGAAENLLAEGNSLDPDNSELAAAITALADKRDEIAKTRRATEARRRAAAEQEAADARAAAEQAQKERAAAAAAAAKPVAEAVKLAADVQPDATADKATSAGAPSVSKDPGAASPGPATADSASGTDATGSDGPDGNEAAEAEPVPTAVSALNRIKYVAPKYPRAAERRNLSGWVDVVFTVDTNGLVKDIVIRGSEPGDTFVAAATKAVEKWEFEPIVEGGTTVEKRAAVRMMFAVE